MQTTGATDTGTTCTAERVLPLAPLAIAGLMVVAGVIWQMSVPTGSDVSWLIEVASRILLGERLYVDVIESNPPAAVLVYVPAALIERATGVSAELAQILITCAASVVSLATSCSILLRSRAGEAAGRFLIAGAFALLILPRFAFSEREHLALILTLPLIVLVFARLERVTVSLIPAVIIGCAGGIGAAIKPHFALLVLMPVLQSCVFRRSFAPAVRVPELFAAACVVVGAILATVVVFPAYFSDVVPMEMETYLHVRAPLGVLLLDPRLLSIILATSAVYLLPASAPLDRLLRTVSASAVGATLAYLAQGKGWAYQLYPAAALVFTAYLTGYISRVSNLVSALRSGGWRARVGAAFATAGVIGLLPVVTLCSTTYFVALPLAPAIRAISERPRILALSDDIGVGHPLTRSVNGIWVSRVCSQLIQSAAEIRRDAPDADTAVRARMAHWIGWERDEILRSLRSRPDVVIVDHQTFALPALVAARTDIAAELAGYTKTASVGEVDLLVRRDLVSERIVSEPTR